MRFVDIILGPLLLAFALTSLLLPIYLAAVISHHLLESWWCPATADAVRKNE